MFKKELTKTLAAFIVGIIIGIVLIGSGEKELGFIMPLYSIGILYGWKEILKIISRLTGTSAEGGLYTTYFGGLWGFTLTLVIYLLALSVVLAFAWIIGIVKCILTLSAAHKQDSLSKYNNG